MRFFHLADLHIGKKVNQVSMLDAQRNILQQILAHTETHQPDAILLAGDLYDRRNPSLEAIQVLDAFLTELVLEKKIPVLAIGGNHDSGERLDFVNGLLAKAGLYMEGAMQLPVPVVRLHDADGAVDFHLLPFGDVPTLQHLLHEEDNDYGNLMKKVVDNMVLATDARHVLMHHGLVLGYEPFDTSESERDLFIGGTDYWRSDRLREFSYVALGHLHRAQKSMDAHIRYSGSPLKYSFSEETHCKQCLCVELDAGGHCDVQALPLVAERDMVTLTGSLEALLRRDGAFQQHQDDYVRVVLTDSGELLDPMARLRQVYPNIMLLERNGTPEPGDGIQQQRGGRVLASRTPEVLFGLFYEQMTGAEPNDNQWHYMKDLLREAREEMS